MQNVLHGCQPEMRQRRKINQAIFDQPIRKERPLPVFFCLYKPAYFAALFAQAENAIFPKGEPI
jgi:hypothetical protein